MTRLADCAAFLVRRLFFFVLFVLCLSFRFCFLSKTDIFLLNGSVKTGPMFVIFHSWCYLFAHSFDARQGSLSDGVQWKDNFILANRNAEFLVNTSPPVLAIDDVRESDAGEYRCRVDFKLTPTKYHRVNLTIIGRWELLTGSFINLMCWGLER